MNDMVDIFIASPFPFPPWLKRAGFYLLNPENSNYNLHVVNVVVPRQKDRIAGAFSRADPTFMIMLFLLLLVLYIGQYLAFLISRSKFNAHLFI